LLVPKNGRLFVPPRQSGKGKAVPVHAVKALRTRRDAATLILNPLVGDE
jgi:hypothetical protein